MDAPANRNPFGQSNHDGQPLPRPNQSSNFKLVEALCHHLIGHLQRYILLKLVGTSLES